MTYCTSDGCSESSPSPSQTRLLRGESPAMPPISNRVVDVDVSVGHGRLALDTSRGWTQPRRAWWSLGWWVSRECETLTPRYFSPNLNPCPISAKVARSFHAGEETLLVLVSEGEEMAADGLCSRYSEWSLQVVEAMDGSSHLLLSDADMGRSLLGRGHWLVSGSFSFR